MLRVSLVLLFATSTIAAPAPKEPPRPNVATLRLAQGKSHLGKEVRAIGRAMGEDPVIHYALWNQEVPEDTEETHFYLKWKGKGLELCFSLGNFHTAWMFNDKVEGFRRYVGELPEGLSFDDDLAAVEKTLGKPEAVLRDPLEDEPGKKAEVKIDNIYKKKGVCVRFRKSVKGDTVITAIALFPPGDAPMW
jgi:hypothetical protein